MAFLTTFVGFLKRVVSLPTLATYGIKRMIVKAVAPGLSRAGYRIQKIGSVMQQAGAKYAEPTFTEDLKLAEQMVQAEGRVPESLRGVLFPINQMVETSMPSAHLYRGFAKVQLGNIETGEIRETWISFYDDQRRSWDDWEQQMRSWFSLSESGETEVITAIDFQEVWHNQGADY